MVVTTDVYKYIGVVVEVLNESLPRASWNIIGDKTNRTLSARYGLPFALIIFQTVMGFIMSIAFLTAARYIFPHLGIVSAVVCNRDGCDCVYESTRQTGRAIG